MKARDGCDRRRYYRYGSCAFLRAQGNEVSVVDMLPEWPTDMQGGDPRFMMEASLETKHCYENHIGMYYNNRFSISRTAC